MTHKTLLKTASVATLLLLNTGQAAQAQTILTTGNGIVRSSLCVGTDCQSGISFVDSTIILKENNTRIKFADTSVAASYPRNDWELEANVQANGGQNRFSILDCGEGSNDGGCTAPINVFTVEANAGSNALYVDDGGRVGLGTGTPVVELHVVDGNTPTLRLEQNTSAGFAAQTWDLAGNETNFFIRDVTGGSRLPFRSRPGAPTSSIDIAASGNVGIGTASPNTRLDIFTSGSSTTVDLGMRNATSDWRLQNFADNFRITKAGTGNAEMSLDGSGNMTLLGNLVTGGGGTCDPGPCDAVFDPTVYTVPSIEDHATAMWDNMHLPAVGPTRPGEPINVTIKLTRMLNELEHAHIYIEQLNAELKEQNERFTAELAALKRQLATQ